MKRWTRNLPAYLQLATVAPQTTLRYRVSLAIDIGGVLLRVYLLQLVFRAAYAGQSAVDGVPLSHTLTVVTLANLQFWVLESSLAAMLYERVRAGTIASELARPAPLLGQLLAYQAGATLARLPGVLLALPFVLAMGGLTPPASATSGLLYAASLVLGYGVATLLGLLIGLVMFWTFEMGSLLVIVRFVNEFFGGALVPLWFFPPLLRRFAALLPFQQQAFVPLAIYTGQLEGGAALAAVGRQAAWVIGLGALAWLVWRRALRRVVIQGG